MAVPEGVKLTVSPNEVVLSAAIDHLRRSTAQVFMGLESLPGTRAVIRKTKTRFAVKVETGKDDLNPYRSWGAYSVAGALDEAYRELCHRLPVNTACSIRFPERILARWR